MVYVWNVNLLNVNLWPLGNTMAKRKKPRPRKWAPRTASKDSQGVVFACRLRPLTREALERAAQRNGWTASAEAEQRLAQSFAIPETSTQALMQVLATAIDSLERRRLTGQRHPETGALLWERDPTATWLTDAYLHAQALAAVQALFKLLQPKGGAPPTEDELYGAGQGRVALEALWNEIRTYRPKKTPPSSRYERRIAALHDGLGPLPDRVLLWGMTGREALKRRDSFPLTEPEMSEFRALSASA